MWDQSVPRTHGVSWSREVVLEIEQHDVVPTWLELGLAAGRNRDALHRPHLHHPTLLQDLVELDGTLGLMHAIWEYVWPRGYRAGVAVIKQRLLGALHAAGVALHEIQPASVVYPKDGPMSGYYYHSGPVVPVYFTETIGPSLERAIARYGEADLLTNGARTRERRH